MKVKQINSVFNSPIAKLLYCFQYAYISFAFSSFSHPYYATYTPSKFLRTMFFSRVITSQNNQTNHVPNFTPIRFFP